MKLKYKYHMDQYTTMASVPNNYPDIHAVRIKDKEETI